MVPNVSLFELMHLCCVCVCINSKCVGIMGINKWQLCYKYTHTHTRFFMLILNGQNEWKKLVLLRYKLNDHFINYSHCCLPAPFYQQQQFNQTASHNTQIDEYNWNKTSFIVEIPQTYTIKQNSLGVYFSFFYLFIYLSPRDG